MAVEPIHEARAWGEATARQLIAAQLARAPHAPESAEAERWRALVEQALGEPRPERMVSLLTSLAELGADGVEAGVWLPKHGRSVARAAVAGEMSEAAPPVAVAAVPATGRGTIGRLVVALAAAVLIKAFVLQVFLIPSTSMAPTLRPGQRLAVDKVTFRVTGIDRADMVVFRAPAPGISPHDTLVKRAVGVGGDRVEAVGGTVLVNGRPAHEPYLSPETTTLDFGPVLVPEGELFVLGDNRLDSLDSRSFGTIRDDLVIGRPIIRLWPLGDWQVL